MAGRPPRREPGRSESPLGATALLIGLAQALAIVPGVSRSGATISMGLFLGYRREEAARFSFLLALPITLGAALVKVPNLLRETPTSAAVLIGMAAAAVFGFLAIRVLLALRAHPRLPAVRRTTASLFAALVVAVLLARRANLG